MHVSICIQYMLQAVHFLMVAIYKKIENYKLEYDDHAISMQKHYDSWTKSIITLGIRPLLMPNGQGIRTQKWSKANAILCPVGGRWGRLDRCMVTYD